MLAAVIGGLFVVPAQARMSHREYIAFKHCERGIVKSCIHRAVIHRHLDYGQALYIAWRESRFDPLAKNSQSTASGLYQFLTSTWAHTPYAAQSIWSAKWSSLAYAWAVSRGYASWWAADF